MSWHRDEEVNKAFIGLMDALVTWERATGRGSRLLFIPDEHDEDIIYLMDGKPVSFTPFVLTSQLEVMRTKIEERGG